MPLGIFGSQLNKPCALTSPQKAYLPLVILLYFNLFQDNFIMPVHADTLLYQAYFLLPGSTEGF